MARFLFLTGGTGFIGAELLRRLIATHPDGVVCCLVRARDAHQLEARRQKLLDYAGLAPADAERVLAVAGDTVREDLGLGSAYGRLARDVTEIYHAAASTKFDLSLEDAQAVNREGARHVLAFARAAQDAGGLRRLHHVSTAYVAGDLEGEIAEDDVPSAPGFRNTYEQTKWESEQLLAPGAAGVPVTCYRPSIVVGDSHSGRTLHFRVLYDPMRWVYSGKMAILPCRPQVRLDVVPVDYVCDAMLALGAQDETEGGLYHLTSGAEGAMSIAQMVDGAVAVANRYHAEIGAEPIERPTVVSADDIDSAPAEEREKLGKLFDLGRMVMGTHVPYMLTEQLFDTARTREALRGTGVACPPLPSYFDRIVRWGVERGFANG